MDISFFHNDCWRPSWILKFITVITYLYCDSTEDDSCQIWSISDKLFPSYCVIC